MLGFNGGLLGVQRVPTTDTASGLWFQNEQSVARRAGKWPIAGGDPYWTSVSLLLRFEGSNGSTTFTDSSSKGLSMTLTGSVALSTSQIKYGSASGGFTAGKLTAPSSSALSMDGDFTIEFWVYRTGATGSFDTAVSAANESNFMIRASLTNAGVYPGGGSNIANTLSFTLNTWHHIAVVRNSGTYKVFKDGTDITTSTYTDSSTRDFSGLIIGDSNVSGRYFVGYIDEFRITKGLARYTANFTPPGAAFPGPGPVTETDPYGENVKLLLSMEGTNGSTTFTDASIGALAVTANGNAQISTARSKYGSSSYLSDGSGDFLTATVPGGLGAGDFTIEMWFYATTGTLFLFNNRTSGDAGDGIDVLSGGQVSTANSTIVSGALSFTQNVWNHFAITRSGSTVTRWLNGVSSGTGTNADNLNGSAFYIGGNNHPSGNLGYLNGNLDEVRITVGVARYTTNFTPPTAPFPVPVAATDPYWSNVSLLLRMDGSNGATTFTDLSNNAHTITVGGDAQVSTTNPKFGTGSLLLDGFGDYLQTPAHSSFAFGTGDFTVECWVYPNVVSSNDGLFTIGSQLHAAVYQNNWTAGTAGSSGDTYGAATAGSWQHFAITRSGSTLRLFINGTQLGFVSNSTDLTNNQLFIGYYFSSVYAWSGKIDEFRVTKGVARYTANFTAPTAAFPNG